MLLAVALALSQYFAGVFFLWSVKEDLKAASPLTIARYHYYYGEDPAVEKRLAWCSGAGGAVVLAVAAALLAPRRRALYGAARFAYRSVIEDAGLLGHRGIILGRLGRRCLMLPGQQGVALAAPPRAGKGTGVVVPNLLNWPDSILCLDIKRENWTLTAGFRQKCGQECFLFDPFAEDGRTAHWNPFFYVSEERNKRINDLQRIAEMLYPDPPNVDPFWTASARSLFLGIALYLFETASLPKTIGEVLRQGMASDAEGFGQHWKRIIEGRRSSSPLSAECVRALYDVIDLAPVTASSIRKTFTSRLDLWLNPILDQATASNDFDLRELRRKPLSIYIGVNPDDLHRLRPVLALFFQQAIGLQTRTLPEHDPSLKRQVLMVLDEFGALGRIPIIAESISYLPGYNVRLLLVIHTPAQLREAYGPHLTETMMKSLAARIVFAPKDMADARAISEELGFTTVQVRTSSRPAWSFSSRGRGRGATVNISEHARPLMLPQEVKELTSEESLLFYEGLPPIRCQKIRYFRDRRFRRRICPPPQLPRSAAPAPRSGEMQASAPPARSAAHEATVADIERIESIELEEFEADFSTVQIPEGSPMTREQLNLAVETYLCSLSGA